MSLKMVLPTPRNLRAAWLALWMLTRGAWRWLVWDNVRAGTIDLAGTPRSFRTLMRLGLWLTLFLLIGLIFSDLGRVDSRLQPLNTDDLIMVYVPELIVPVVFGLLAIAWAFLLAGALQAPWPIKLIVLFLFGLFDFGLMVIAPLSFFVSFGVSLGIILAALVQIAGWLCLLGLFLVRGKQPARPGLDFSLALATVSALLFVSLYALQWSGETFQSQTTLISGMQLATALQQIDVFLIPFLLIAGVEVVQSGISLTGWVSGQLRRSARLRTAVGRRWWELGLGMFLMVRLAQQWLWPLFTGAPILFSWGAFVIGGVLLALFVKVRPDPTGVLPGWVVPSVSVLLIAILLVQQIWFLVGLVMSAFFVRTSGSALASKALADNFSLVFTWLVEWNDVLVSGVVFLVGLALWSRACSRRQPLPPAAWFAFVLGGWVLWWHFTRADRPLGALTFRYEQFTAMTTLVLSALFLGAIGLRRLTPRILTSLSAAAVMFWVLGARDWLSDPLSPLFVLLGAQVAFVSVSVFLNVMNAGNRFGLNTGSPRWPRLQRGLMYFGYALLTVISMLWLAASHNADGLALKDAVGEKGFLAIGVPLALWALMTGSEDVLGPESEK